MSQSNKKIEIDNFHNTDKTKSQGGYEIYYPGNITVTYGGKIRPLTIDQKIEKNESLYKSNMIKSTMEDFGKAYRERMLIWSATRLTESIKLRMDNIENKYCA